MSYAAAARTIVVLADCHIHPAGGVAFNAETLAAFTGADLIVTLGDMGESSGLDALAQVAPVMGVRGMDDQDDPRTAPSTRVIEAGGKRVGCVFDPVQAGLATAKEPLAWADGAAEAAFGGPVDVVLWASTHVPSVERADGRLRVNPGSATVPDKGSARSFARLTVGEGGVQAEIVEL